ncbi:S8 family serine peptidase [candidate division KSB1 bacterium]|nr:S8 family serine peptidase [candidate division KSB1 bacterium]NIR71504.1 S8 family serine peptidase [candidate division KSB1 bacterium]NIT73087.1 S8 family serine peptidase [candidate division KSB1 bacterium]NIU26996.1 S8 family serine peptidase [candidate division KSB1 bacterium]NIU92644.1 S8 family serine peptidase [candidate division KSB1 bacterium]
MKNIVSFFLSIGVLCVFFTAYLPAQESNFIPGEVIVHFEPDIIDFPVGSDKKPIGEVNILNRQAQEILTDIGTSEIGRVFRFAVPNDTLKTNRLGQIVRVADASQIYKLKMSGNVLDKVNELQLLPFVIFAEPNYIGTSDAEPNDALFVEGFQWGLHNTGQFDYTANVDVDAPEAWDITTGSSNVLVATLDSGIDYNHPDLGADFGAYPNQKIVEGYNYIDDNTDPIDLSSESHGTAVAGIIGALTNNEDGSNDHRVAGIGGGWANSPYGFKLLPVKVTDPTDDGSWSHNDLANGILWATQTKGAEVLNISLSSNVGSSTLRFAITEAFNLGALIVVSMGNNNTSSPWWPAAYDNSLISVGAIDFHGRRIIPENGFNFGSNTGSWLDVMAPGTDHWTTARLDSGGYREFGGTSCSAPFVSGFAGLILSVDPSASFEKVEAIIRASGTEYPSWDDQFGYGYIKMRKGLDLLSDPNSTEYNWTASGGSASFDNVRFTLGSYNYDRYKVTKSVSFPQNFTAVPVVWGQRNGSTGAVRWPADETQLNYNYTGIEPGSESATGCQLVTFLYKKFAMTGQFLGWVPTSPSDVTYAYSVLGVPQLSVTISGPSSVEPDVIETWTANVTGGSGSISYQWYVRYEGSSTWNTLGTNQDQSHSFSEPGTTNDLKVEVTSDGEFAEDTHAVYVTSGGGGISKEGNETAQLPQQFALHQNHPNPFNPTTEIRYDLPVAGEVTLSIFNVMGQKIRTLIEEQKPAGFHRIFWDGRDELGRQVGSGVFLYRISVRPNDSGASPFEAVRKMTLLR